ncbi:hypothetical protein LTR37_011164 [Vermiconidia calcicola]|uniref:Uncharacterized protein n=1 Tax=Vermiconidia calcicola TaxID=1690605 RepID=A0ACC3N2X6_9PEZI|nr:hypothetical protein LTR37_011164 [Vermiconidia calcicola]
MANATGNSTGDEFLNQIINGNAGDAAEKEGTTTKSFVLNLALALGLFTFQLTGFLLLKSSNIALRRGWMLMFLISSQPKTYLVQDRLRVEAIPINPFKWIYRIFTIKSDELKLKCGLDGYFAIRFLRAMLFIFVPLMVIVVTVLLPVNYNGGKNNHVFLVDGRNHTYNVVGLDTLSWQNVAPNETDRYWAHLVCALLVISWTLYRIYREKLHFVDVRQQYLTSPEHRLKASSRTVLVTNIPSDYRSEEALRALFDVFVDNDDRSKLNVWLNRDYGALRTLVSRRRKLCHALEKEELRIQRLVNKEYRKHGDMRVDKQHSPQPSTETTPVDGQREAAEGETSEFIAAAFEADSVEKRQLWHKYLKSSTEAQVTLAKDSAGDWNPVSSYKFWVRGHKSVPKSAWLRAEISRLTVQIDEMLPDLDKEVQLVVPALCRKLAVLVGTPTRSRREVVCQDFYFTFLFIELVLVTSISSGLIATVSTILANPTTIVTTLATDLPKAANYFFNYLIVQALAFSGSLLFQYLRILFITTIWPWFTQTPREEAWLQTTIPHQIHNYYYVQRNKVDTHGQLFENALSQLFAGVYVMEITLIGLFFIVTNSKGNVVCIPQASIMIVALGLTAVFHYALEQSLQPLYELLPVTLEDPAADAEKELFAVMADNRQSDEHYRTSEGDGVESSSPTSGTARPGGIEKSRGRAAAPNNKQSSQARATGISKTAADARKTLLRLHNRVAARPVEHHTRDGERWGNPSRIEVADQLGAAISRYPDELLDLSAREREAELRAAYQDPITREVSHPACKTTF